MVQTIGLVQKTIFVGDLLQLPPVNGRPVFQNVGSTIVMQRLGSGCAINIWKEMVEYDELSINWRQKGDQEFFAIPFCHYCYVWHFTITCPFCWLVAIHFIRSGLLVTGIYLGLAGVLCRAVQVIL